MIDLLAVRYIPIFTNGKHYPTSELKENDILYKHTFDNGAYIYTTNNEIIVNGVAVKKDIVEEHHHLFRKLHWWEGVNESDLPNYVKYEEEIRKIISYRIEGFSPQAVVTLNKPFANYDRQYINLEDCQPSTEDEYNNYISLSEKK